MPDEKPEGQEEKVDELTILCEIPLKVSIGERKFLVMPPTITKMVTFEAAMLSLRSALTETDLEVAKNDLIAALLTILIPNDGNGDATSEEVADHLDTVQLAMILGFYRKVSDVEEMAKKVEVPKSALNRHLGVSQ